MIHDIFTYLVVAGCIFLSAILTYHRPASWRNVVGWGWVLFLSLFAALRNGLGQDFENYLLCFNHIPTLSHLTWDILFAGEVEAGWVLVNALVKSLGLTYRYLLWGVAFISLATMRKACQRMGERYQILLLFFYFCAFFLHHQFNVMRHGLVTSLVWLAISYIPERRIWRYIGILLVASCFHVVGIIALPLYWIVNRRPYSIAQSIALLLGCLLLSYIAKPLIFFIAKYNLIPRGDEFIARYQNADFSYSPNILFLCIKLSVLFLFHHILQQKARRKEKEVNTTLKERQTWVLYNTLLMYLGLHLLFRKDALFNERIAGILLPAFFMGSIVYIGSQWRFLRKIQPVIWGGFLLVGLSLIGLSYNKYSNDARQFYYPYQSILSTHPEPPPHVKIRIKNSKKNSPNR